jgi:UDP-N-acetylglucosamine--N-acetylmuramyl-(pentapeptide) pyrophosphoryl-undecaprenol N-acetylglucosamine transferase
MQKNKQTVVFTGGHHNSALVVVKELSRQGNRIIWFGHKHTMWRAKNVSAEYKEVTKAELEFVNLFAGKFYNISNPLRLAKIPLGFLHALFLLIKYKPALIFSFGGYLAVPTVICGWLLGIPCVTHEQTIRAGKANQLISWFCKKIFLTWEESEKYFSKDKTYITGLPLRSEFNKVEQCLVDFKNSKSTLLVLGGKQGSHTINQAVGKYLEQILEKYNVIHQTGDNLQTKDFHKLMKKKKQLSKNQQQNYLIKPYFFAGEIVKAYHSADIVVCRSGAHTIYELMFLGKPALLIPYPWAYNNEQAANAKKYKKIGAAEILEQENINKLFIRVEELHKNLKQYQTKASQARNMLVENSLKKIINQIDSLIN